MNLPTGAVTLLFAEVKRGTSRLAGAPDAHLPVSSLRQALVYALHANNGTIISMDNESLQAAFPTPLAALEVAVSIQQIYHPERAALPIEMRSAVRRFRTALHTGRVEIVEGKYAGETVEHTEQLLAAGHSGQILVSAQCVGALHSERPEGVRLISLGKFQFPGTVEGEPVYQVVHADLPTEFPQLRLAGASPTNLPVPWTSFVGRETELAELQNRLAQSRILTLIGAEGIGKSRLAIRLAADLRGAFPDGVWVAELPAITDIEIVPDTIAWSLDALTGYSPTLTDAVIAHLRDRKALLVVDAGEANTAACARLVTALIRACPGVKFLLCARKGLGLREEAIYCVPALSTVPGESSSEAERLCQERAAQLPTPLDLDGLMLSELCTVMGGMPLAMELAIGSLAANPGGSFDDLIESLRGSQHSYEQTLQLTLDWSYGRLTETERTLLKRLSVFQSGWSLEAATAVCCDEHIPADHLPSLLEALRASGFVAAEERAGFTREHLRDAVRRYAETRLAEQSEAATIHQRHADYFTQLAEEGALGLTGTDPEAWKVYLYREYINFRTALLSLRHQAGGSTQEIRLATALLPILESCGHVTEGRTLLARATEAKRAPNAPEEDYAETRARYFAAIDQCRLNGNRASEAKNLNNLARLALGQHDYVTAMLSYEQALAVFRETCDTVQEARTLHCLGSAARDGNEYANARHYYERALTLNRALGRRQDEAHNLNGLARVALLEGDTGEAVRRFREGLDVFHELGDHAWEAHNMGQILRLSLPSEPLWERTPLHAGTAR